VATATATATVTVTAMTATTARTTERMTTTTAATVTAVMVAAAFLPAAAMVILVAVLGRRLLGAYHTYLRNHTDFLGLNLCGLNSIWGVRTPCNLFYFVLMVDPI
jgi:hypothetical protein